MLKVVPAKLLVAFRIQRGAPHNHAVKWYAGGVDSCVGGEVDKVDTWGQMDENEHVLPSIIFIPIL